MIAQYRAAITLSLGLAICLVFMTRPSLSQEQEEDSSVEATSATAESDAPMPQTTDDPEIPVDQLELLLKPLTQEELVVEVEGWRDLLKAKVAEISEVEIARKRANEVVKEESEEITEEAEADAPDTVEEAEATQQEALDQVPILQEERTALVDRVNAAIDALEAKGGDVEQYNAYVTAVSGLEIDATDAAATWTAITSWITSEQGGGRWTFNILKFLGILLGFYLLSKGLAALADRATSAWEDASVLLRDFVHRFVQQATMVIGFIAALAALEVDIGPILAAVAGAGLVVGLALQDTLGNFASGLMMLAYKPFDVGHVIEAGGIFGKVESMNMVSTHIKTFDNRHVIVPNNQIWGGTITNASVSNNRRVDLTFGIGYDDDIAKAQSILERLVRDHPKVLTDPEPLVKLNELGDSSINFICWPWCQAADYLEVKWSLLRSVKEEFDRNGISIPFPQQDVHVYQQARSTSS